MLDDVGGNAMALTEGETQILLRLADNAQKQSEIASDQVVVMQRIIDLMSRLEDRLEKLDTDRQETIHSINLHTTSTVRNWKTAMTITIGLAMLVLGMVEVLDITVERWQHWLQFHP